MVMRGMSTFRNPCLNKTMEGKDITYVATDHNSETGREESMESPLYDFFGPYEKLTILRKYIVDNFKSSVASG